MFCPAPPIEPVWSLYGSHAWRPRAAQPFVSSPALLPGSLVTRRRRLSAFPAAVAGTPRVRAKAPARTGRRPIRGGRGSGASRGSACPRSGVRRWDRPASSSLSSTLASTSSRPDLAGASLRGHNTVDGSDDVHDEVGHGTMVAEVALGRGNNHRQGTGVCWRCKLLPVKVAPNGSASGDQLAAGITWAADNGADVINVSLVLKGRDDAVEQAVATRRPRWRSGGGVRGERRRNAASYPASYHGVISVVGVDEKDRPYAWSTRGAWAGLSAPGCAVVADAGAGRRTSAAVPPQHRSCQASQRSYCRPARRGTASHLCSSRPPSGVTAPSRRPAGSTPSRLAAALGTK